MLLFIYHDLDLLFCQARRLGIVVGKFAPLVLLTFSICDSRQYLMLLPTASLVLLFFEPLVRKLLLMARKLSGCQPLISNVPRPLAQYCDRLLET